VPIEESIFQQWAPAGALWSNWVKPVVFASMDEPPLLELPLEVEGSREWIPRPAEHAALVFDLPGAEGVKWGLVAAQLGYRPVPLYNALPLPIVSPEERKKYYDGQLPNVVVVDMRPILAGLWQAAAEIEKLSLASDAPPAFLLDANRRTAGIAITPGTFDNRSISFTTDFPSADFLRTHQIRKAIFVQATGSRPQSDLNQTLFDWQKNGLPIERKSLDETGAPISCRIKPSSRFGALWLQLLARFSLRRNSFGGFGDMVPESGSGGVG
jgi:hypothetical protein